MNPIYIWKTLPESVRAVGLALIAYGLTVLVEFEPSAVIDWKAFAVGVGVGFLHVLGTAGLAQMGRSGR